MAESKMAERYLMTPQRNLKQKDLGTKALNSTLKPRRLVQFGQNLQGRIQTSANDAYASVGELRIFEYQYEQTNC